MLLLLLLLTSSSFSSSSPSCLPLFLAYFVYLARSLVSFAATYTFCKLENTHTVVNL